MDYTDDLCMTNFTPHQVNRIRCTIENYRPNLPVDNATGVRVVQSRGNGLLRQNTPNPFSPETSIGFDLPRAGEATLRVLDVRGRTIRTLASGSRPAGRHEVTWRGDDAAGNPVAAGVYFYRLEAAGQTETRRMVLTK